MLRGNIAADTELGVPAPRRPADARPARPAPLVVVVTDDPEARAEIVRSVGARAVVLAVPDAQAAVALLSPAGAAARTGREATALDGLIVDDREHRVRWQGSSLPLTQHEHQLFCLMATDLGRAWTHQELHQAVWGSAYLSSGSDLHSTVKRLRRKLDTAGVPLVVESVRGVGFRLMGHG